MATRTRGCEMNTWTPSDGPWEDCPCGKPTTRAFDYRSETVRLCEKHAEQWKRDVDETEEVPA